jgi:Rha family phage regulatory protein
MNILIKLVNNQQITNSIVISEQFGRDHKNVLASIRKLVDNGTIGRLDCKPTSYTDKSNRNQKMYELTERGFLIAMPFIGGNKAEQGQIRLVDAFLETHQRPSLPQNFAQALRLSAELEEQKQIAEQQRDEAIRTKAEIGSKREATAMNTASTAIKKANKLKIELDQSQRYCTIKRMQMLCHGQKFNWKLLKKTCIAMGLPAKPVFDANYGKVNAYHLDVWKETYAITLAEEVE